MNSEPEPTVVQAGIVIDGRPAYVVTGGPGPLVTPDGAPFPDAGPESETDSGWLARDNEPDAGAWNTGVDGINQDGPEPDPGPEAKAG